jgi:HK97 family phage major capsid protein
LCSVIYQNPGQGLPATLWNKPVVLVEGMPTSAQTAVSTSFVLFGDLKKTTILGYKGAISADRFNAGVVRNVADSGDINLITSDREAIRWVERVGYIAILPTAVTRLKTAAS